VPKIINMEPSLTELLRK